jgi:hypothetical protein
LEYEVKGGFVFTVDIRVGVDETKELEESPEDEAEEEGIPFGIVSGFEKGAEGENPYAVFPARIIRPIVMSG